MNFQTQGYEDLELSTQLIIKEAGQRNISVEILDKKTNFIRLTKNGKTEVIRQATRTSADSYISSLIMENKLVTKKLLKEKDIRVPEGRDFSHIVEAENQYSFFSSMDIVIKPNTTNFGKGVVILKKGFTKEEFLSALKEAFSFDDSVLVEEFIPGKEYRFLVIDKEVVAILLRIPANVKGDGISKISELVEIKNKNPIRGSGYTKPLEKIKLGDTEISFLKEQGKTPGYIPLKDEIVYLRKNSNISTGGDSRDYTDEVHEGYKTIALKAVEAVGARISGADIIIRDIDKKPEKDNHGIIELNFNPAIHIHSFPYIGKDRKAAGKVLNLLGF